MEQAKFKKGDKVVCVSAGSSDGILGTNCEYIVIDELECLGGWLLKLRGVAQLWARNRFEKVPEKAPREITNTGKRTRCDQVLSHLLAGHSLTQGEAIMLGFGTRLAATIHTLKQRGNNIITRMKTDTNGYDYAEYSLVTRNSRNGNIKRV